MLCLGEAYTRRGGYLGWMVLKPSLSTDDFAMLDNMTDQADLTISGEGRYGPAMSALPNDRMRAFVVACCQPTAEGAVNYTDAALKAGYSPGNRAAAQVQGSRLAHDDRIQAAMLEESQRRFSAALPLATAAIVSILTTSPKNADRMKAAAMIFNRAGMPERTEHSVTVTRTETQAEKIERIIKIAGKLGLDAKSMLGNIGIAIPKQLGSPQPVSSMPEIETADFVEVIPGLEDFLS